MTVQLPDNSLPPRSQGVVSALMTTDTLNDLRDELEQLRRHTRLEIAERLREARAYGDGSNNDEHHAVVEEQMVLEARLRSLEATIARAKVVDRRELEDGVAVLGSTLLIEDLEWGRSASIDWAATTRRFGRTPFRSALRWARRSSARPPERSSPSTFQTAAHGVRGSRRW